MELLFGMLCLGLVVWTVWKVGAAMLRDTAKPRPDVRTPRTRVKATKSEPIRFHPLPGTPLPVSSRGRVPVVGEYYRQAALMKVVAGRPLAPAGAWEAALREVAYLVAEPNNPHDSNAVRVDMAAKNGFLTVGYLSRDIAETYQPLLRSLADAGWVACCQARIVDSGQIAVYLHLAGPEECLLNNALPDDALPLPPERQCAVTGENQHQDYLSGLPLGRAWATLHPALVATGKYRGGPTIEVRLDGGPVGVLSGAQGSRYQEVLSFATLAACEADVFDGSKGIEVQVHLPRVD